MRPWVEHAFGGGAWSRSRALIGVVGVLSGPVANAVGVGGAAAARPARTYVVRPGDTLWSIARRSSPSADPRLVVGAIATANDVDPGGVGAGTAARHPVRRLTVSADGFDHTTSWGYRARGHHMLWPHPT